MRKRSVWNWWCAKSFTSLVVLVLQLGFVGRTFAQQAIFELKLSYLEEKNEIELIAISPQFTEKANISLADDILQRSAWISDVLEKRRLFKQKKYEDEIAYLSNIFILPFQKQLNNSDLLIITIDTNLVGLPFEYFEMDGVPISLIKSIIFKLSHSKTEVKTDTALQLRSGIIISDRTADPERAAKTAHSYFPDMAYFSIEEITPDKIETQPIDLLLISAHGYSDKSTHRGVLGWNHEHFNSKTLSSLNPKITYFDSCQQGVNLNYIEALSQNNSLNYYLGPIISNDSGDSSTKMIKWFFTKIKGNLSPTQAFFETKTRLFSVYNSRRQLVQKSKSLCFRLYVI